MYLFLIILGSALLVTTALFTQSKKAEYEMWLEDFENELGFIAPPEDEIIIRDLFNENSSDIKWAVEYYKEVKYPIKLGDGIWDSIEKNAARAELLTIEECIERYDLTEEQINELKKNMNEKQN